MIPVLNNLPEEHDMFLDSLENCLTSSGPDALTIKAIQENLNHWYVKIKIKRRKNKREGISSL